MFPCPGCGAALKFNIETQTMKCDFCDSKYDPESISKQSLTKENSDEEKEFFETTIFTCPQCGGEMMGDDTDATAFCSYCGAVNVLNTRIANEKRPNCIIPFKITKQQCATLFLRKTRSKFFVPKELKKDSIIDSFRGIYTPYFSYRFTQSAELKLTSQKSRQKGDYEYTDHYMHTGDLRAVYTGVAFDAATNFYDDISEQVGPYDVKEVKNFNPAYMAGFYADISDTEHKLYDDEAMSIINNNTAGEVEKTFPGVSLSGQDNSKLNFKFGTSTDGIDAMMYPVWFMSYRIKDKIGYATINGQNGKVVADYPIDKMKFVILSFLIALPIFAILHFMPAISPKITMVLAVILAMAMQWLIRFQAIKIDEHENFSKDKAVLAKLRKVSKKDLAEIDQKKGRKKKLKKKKGDSSMSYVIAGIFVFSSIGFYAVMAISFLALPIMMIATAICCLSAAGKIGRGFPIFVSIALTVMEIISSLLFIASPPADYWYYGAAIILIGLMIPAMLYVMECLNDMCLRPFPQFNKKGGDDDAK